MSVERSGQVGEKELAEPLGLEAAGRIFLVIADLRLNLALHAVIREHNAPDRVPSPQPRERRARCGVFRWVRADDLDPSRDLADRAALIPPVAPFRLRARRLQERCLASVF